MSVGPESKAEGSLTCLPLTFPFLKRLAHPMAARKIPLMKRNVHRGSAMAYDFWTSFATFGRMSDK